MECSNFIGLANYLNPRKSACDCTREHAIHYDQAPYVRPTDLRNKSATHSTRADKDATFLNLRDRLFHIMLGLASS